MGRRGRRCFYAAGGCHVEKEGARSKSRQLCIYLSSHGLYSSWRRKPEQDCQVPRASTPSQTVALRDRLESGWFLAPYAQMAIFPTFWNRSMFLQRVSTRKKRAAKSFLPQYAPTATEVLLLYRGTAYVNSCMQASRSHPELD